MFKITKTGHSQTPEAPMVFIPSKGSSSSLLLAPLRVDGEFAHGGFARFAAEPERLRRFLREMLEVVEKVEGEQKGEVFTEFEWDKHILDGEVTVFDGQITIFNA